MRGEAATYTEPGPSLSDGGRTIRLPSGGGTRDFTVADLRSVVELAALLPETASTGPESAKAIALHRFGTALREALPADAIIDFVTALEALLLRDDKELSYKLALRGARYVASDATERRQVFRDLRDLYNTRSGLLHGAAKLHDSGYESLRQRARQLTSRLLVKALREGWPTPGQLDDLVLA